MDLTLLKDSGQIFAWTAAGAFFAYKFCTGWFHPDLSLGLLCERKPVPTGTTSAPIEVLTLVATVKKGPNMTIRLVDFQARITFGDQAMEKRFEGIERRCVKDQKIQWTDPPSKGPIFLSLAPGDETQFSTFFEVPRDTICVASVILFARNFVPGLKSQRENRKPNPHQWRASCVSLPAGDTSVKAAGTCP